MPDRAVSDDPSVQSQLDRLAQVSLPRDVPGFERIRHLLARLGNPERALPPVLHVAGTNGKGSTCAFLRSALEAAGLSVHVYTSPHLVRLNERIRIAGRLIDDEALAALLGESVDAVEGAEITFFEATTAAAFLAFARTPADACIVEVGIGGRLDATNVISAPCVCGITQLGLDHSIYLGDTLAEIAAEKAGIAKRGVPLVTELYPEEARRKISEVAAAIGAPWYPRGANWDAATEGASLTYRDDRGMIQLPLPAMPGGHQAANAALAVAMLRHQQTFEIPDWAFSAMGRTIWPARLQRLPPGPLHDLLPPGSELWLDGAHNAAAAEAIAAFFRRRLISKQPFYLVIGMLSDRPPASVLGPFAASKPVVHAVPVVARDFHAPAALTEAARGFGLKAVAAAGAEEALASIARQAKGTQFPPMVLIAGSLYLAGEVLRKNGEIPD